MDAGNTNVGVLGADGAKHKDRFYIDLIPNMTNIVSLKKLRREAGETVSDDSSEENEKEEENYSFQRLPKKKSRGALAIEDKVQHNGGVEHFKSSKEEIKKRRKELEDHFGEEDAVQVDARPRKRAKNPLDTAAVSAVKGDSAKSKPLGGFQIRLKTSGGVLILKKNSHSCSKLNPGKNTYFRSAAHHLLHSRSSMRTNIKQQRKIGGKQLPCQILPFRGHARGTSLVNMTGIAMLDLSISQLKMFVEHSKARLLGVQQADASLPDTGIQLSPELKEKLGEVARWMKLKDGRISEKLIDRLIDILGKYLKRKTLKKILREMILEDLYANKAEQTNFKQIKHELVKMIKRLAPSLNTKVYSASSIGDHLEDKLCDLYHTFIQGIDEDIGPSVVRRLFAKLVDLWPKGTMNRHEIREAICRANERRVLPL